MRQMFFVAPEVMLVTRSDTDATEFGDLVALNWKVCVLEVALTRSDDLTLFALTIRAPPGLSMNPYVNEEYPGLGFRPELSHARTQNCMKLLTNELRQQISISK